MRLYSFLLCRRFCVLTDKPRANMARSTTPVPLSTTSISAAHSPNTEMEEIMTTINLRDYYPFYTSDNFIDVPDEVYELLKEFDRKEAAYRLRTYRHKAYYSLDRNDGIEHEALFVSPSPYELYERKISIQELHTAISNLPDKQAKRVYAHFILGMSQADIAKVEGVSKMAVCYSIEKALKSMRKFLKNSLD